MGASATVKYHYSRSCFTYSVRPKGVETLCIFFDALRQHLFADRCGGHYQVGSLAGAAHLLNDNAGVLR